MTRVTRRNFCAVLAGIVGIAGSGISFHASAQTQYPNRPITLIAPAAPGGLTDMLARAVGDELGKRLNTTVIVENKQGAGGTVAMASLAREKSDGYTLILAFQGPITVAPALYETLPYNASRDFTVIHTVSKHYQALAVNASAPFKSVQDVIDAAKREPGKLSYGSAGVGSSAHLAGEVFQLEAGIKLNHVPYKGEAPALRDVAGGMVDMAFATLVATKPIADAQRVRVLGLGAATRAGAAPDLPTFAETGLPGYDVPAWYGLMAKSETPPAIVEILRRKSAEMLKDPAFRARLVQMSIEPWDLDAPQFEQFLREDTSRWRTVVGAANIKID
jgi:tripartite-type tricarboxylate transporter receptor subunit TctC